MENVKICCHQCGSVVDYTVDKNHSEDTVYVYRCNRCGLTTENLYEWINGALSALFYNVDNMQADVNVMFNKLEVVKKSLLDLENILRSIR